MGYTGAGRGAVLRPWTILRVVLAAFCLLVAGYFYLRAQSGISGLGAGDSAGRAMGSGFTFLAELALWIALAGFVAVANFGARPPAGVAIANGVLVVAGAIASIAALTIMETPTWVRITPSLMPPLVALCGIWTAASVAKSATLRRRVAIGLALLGLPLVVVPFYEMQRPEAESSGGR